jgi:hypothetical protein
LGVEICPQGGNLAKLTGKGWRDLSGKYREDAKNLRSQILGIVAAICGDVRDNDLRFVLWDHAT